MVNGLKAYRQIQKIGSSIAVPVLWAKGWQTALVVLLPLPKISVPTLFVAARPEYGIKEVAHTCKGTDVLFAHNPRFPAHQIEEVDVVQVPLFQQFFQIFRSSFRKRLPGFRIQQKTLGPGNGRNADVVVGKIVGRGPGPPIFWRSLLHSQGKGLLWALGQFQPF